MMDVFLLWHNRPRNDGDTDAKLVGVYSSEGTAEAARVRKLGYPGFADHPDGFFVDRYTVDKDAWSEGFGVDDA